MLGLCLVEIFTVAGYCQEATTPRQAEPRVQLRDSPGSNVPAMTANIPFEFWIGSQKMPSGTYTMEVLVPSVSILRSADGKLEQQLYMVDIGPPVTAEESRLVFVVRDGKEDLMEVWCVSGKRKLVAQNPQDSSSTQETRTVSLSYSTQQQ
jgi:hypothetical protein